MTEDVDLRAVGRTQEGRDVEPPMSEPVYRLRAEPTSDGMVLILDRLAMSRGIGLSRIEVSLNLGQPEPEPGLGLLTLLRHPRPAEAAVTLFARLDKVVLPARP